MQQDPNSGSVSIPLKTPHGTKQLPKLRISDIIRIKNRISQERREKIIANAAATIGTDNPQTNQQLHEHDSRPVTRGDVVEWALLPEGILPTLAMAQLRAADGEKLQGDGQFEAMLKKAEEQVDSWDADWNDLVVAAAGVLNVQLERKPAAEESPPLTAGGAGASEPSSTSRIETTSATPTA
jgi:hypothetical protein